MNVLIELERCVFGYEKRAIVRVEEVGLSVGRCLGIFGPNGAGKTTLVRGITGLLAPMQGTVRRAADLRIGYLPQQRSLELHWPMTGLDAASLALSAQRTIGWIDRKARVQILESMARLNVRDLAHHSFAKLSGGQQQRLMLAGALAADPQILILDEPTEGLDVRSRRALLELLRAMSGEGLCTVMISHEVQDLMFLADEVAWLHPGECAGEPSDVEIVAPVELVDRMVHVKEGA